MDKTCPICSKTFKYDYDQEMFESHVNDHFKESRESHEARDVAADGTW